MWTTINMEYGDLKYGEQNIMKQNNDTVNRLIFVLI